MSDVARPFTKPTPETVRAFVESVPMYRDDVDDPMFWPDERLRARRDELLQRQLGWVSEASAFYRRRFDEEGVDVAAGVVEYQLLVRNRDEGDPLSPDRLVLRVGIDPSADRAGWEAGGDRVAALREAVFNSTEVHPDVELVANLSDIYDPTRDFKARRIVDERAPLE